MCIYIHTADIVNHRDIKISPPTKVTTFEFPPSWGLGFSQLDLRKAYAAHGLTVNGEHFDLLLGTPRGMEVDQAMQMYPIGSMYGMFTYIWWIFMANLGKYTIHGLFWVWYFWGISLAIVHWVGLIM